MSMTVQRMVARYEADIADVRAKLTELERLHTQMEKKTEAAGQATQKRVDQTTAAVSRMKFVYASVAGTIASVLASAMVRLADQSKAVENQLRGIGIASDTARKKVYALAIETRTPLEATVGLLRAMQKSLTDQSIEQTLRQVGTLNRLMTIGGLDAGQRGSVTLQFGQALQSGVLQGDELRALRESAPVELMDALAKRAGGTIEQLRKLGEQGKLTRDVMVGALNDLEQVSKDKFGAFDVTVLEAIGNFRTAIVGVAGEMNAATGATDTMATAIQAVSGFMTEYSGAAATLAKSLSLVAQLALVAAGVRGLAALGGAGSGILAAARSVNTLNASLVATVAAQKTLGGLLTMFGGPIPLAIFATTSAMVVLSKITETTAERLDAVDKSRAKIKEVTEELNSLQMDRAVAAKDLIAKEEAIQKAIEDQAPAAQRTAEAERRTIEQRIADTDRLIAAKEKLLELEQQAEAEALSAAERNLIAEAQRATQLPGFSGDAAGLAAYRAQDWEALTKAYADYLNKQDEHSSREVEWLKNYTELTDKKKKAEVQAAEDRRWAFAEHLREWNAELARFEKATADYVAKANERTTKLAEIDRRRKMLETQLTAADGDPNAGDRAIQLRLALRQLDEDERKLMDIQDRTNAIIQTVMELRSLTADSLQFDEDGSVRQKLEGLDDVLEEIEQRGEDISNQELTEFEAQVYEVVTAAEKLREEFDRIAGTSFDALGENFDRLRGKMESMGLPYASEMATAQTASSIIDVLKQHEGFDPNGRGGNAYWDVDAWRAGYGSDHIYKKQDDGSWIRTEVYKGMKVSLEEANYSLMMRLQREFIPGIVNAIGAARWENLTTAQQASLASMAYNYGSLPSNVVSALRDGTNQDVAAAIAKRAMDNPELDSNKDGLPDNYKRRMSEAAAFGDTSRESTQYETTASEQRRADEERKKAAEDLLEKQKEYLKGLAESAEKTALETELIGKTVYERERAIRRHEEYSRAIEAGLELDVIAAGETLTLREKINAEIEKEIQLKQRSAVQDEINRQKEVERQEENQRRLERINELKSFHAEIERDIQGLIIGSIMKTGDWRDMAEALIQKLAEAYLYAGLFNQGPYATEDGGKGLLGGVVDGIFNWLTGPKVHAKGGVFGAEGSIPLSYYSRGGVAYRPQLAMFGEGATPEAYVPLPDGRSIPVTIKTPDVPTAGAVGNGGLVRVVLELNNDMLEDRIVEGAGPVAVGVTRRGITEFSRNQMPERVRAISNDPKRTRY